MDCDEDDSGGDRRVGMDCNHREESRKDDGIGQTIMLIKQKLGYYYDLTKVWLTIWTMANGMVCDVDEMEWTVMMETGPDGLRNEKWTTTPMTTDGVYLTAKDLMEWTVRRRMDYK